MFSLHYYIKFTFCSTLQDKWSVPPKRRVLSKTKYFFFSSKVHGDCSAYICIYMCQINTVCFKGNEKSLCPLTHIFHSQSAHLISSGKQDCHIWETEISPDCFLPLHACCVRVLLQNTQQETQNSVLGMFSAWFMSWCDKKNTDHVILSCGSAPNKWM